MSCEMPLAPALSVKKRSAERWTLAAKRWIKKLGVQQYPGPLSLALQDILHIPRLCEYFVNAMFPLYSCLENNHRQGFRNKIIIIVFLRNCANEPFSRLIRAIAQMESSQTKKTTNVCWGGVQHHDKTRKQEQQFYGINSPAPNWQRSCWLILKWFVARWNECSFYRKIGRWNESREGS